MKDLSKLYYNPGVSVTYGRPASSLGVLAEEVARIKRTDGLRFYERYKEACLSGEAVDMPDEEPFREDEARNASPKIAELVRPKFVAGDGLHV